MRIFKFVLAIIFIMGINIGCGPHKTEQFVEIQPNETAFLVPLEGATKSGQKNFFSEQYLNENKIAAKRISLPLRKWDTGRMWFDYSYIPTMQVIKVIRKPETREWTSAEDKGTSRKNEALWVESKDSIGFGVGVNITALIEEADSSRFLYKYSGTPLAVIIDTDIRGFANGILSREFAKYNLEEGRGKKNEIFEIVKNDTITQFKEFGIMISSLGLAEGLVYQDKEIQNAINEKFLAEMNIQIKAQDALAQKEVNKMNVSIAVAEKDAALEFKKAEKARTSMVALEIQKMEAQAKLVRAEASKVLASRADLKLPNIVPSGSGLLMGLDNLQ